MEVLSSRIHLRPTDPIRSRAFYRDVIGLGIFREFGEPDSPGTVFFLGNGLLEVSGRVEAYSVPALSLWLQVRDVKAEHERIVLAGAESVQEPGLRPWGLVEAGIRDPDGVIIMLVEVPEDHPMRRDQRHPGHGLPSNR